MGSNTNWPRMQNGIFQWSENLFQHLFSATELLVCWKFTTTPMYTFVNYHFLSKMTVLQISQNITFLHKIWCSKNRHFFVIWKFQFWTLFQLLFLVSQFQGSVSEYPQTLKMSSRISVWDPDLYRDSSLGTEKHQKMTLLDPPSPTLKITTIDIFIVRFY